MSVFPFFFGKLSAFFAGNFRKKGRSFGNFFSGKFPVFLKAAVSRQMACWNAVPWTRDPLENRPVQSGCVEPGQVRAVDWASGATWAKSPIPRLTLIEAVLVTNHSLWNVSKTWFPRNQFNSLSLDQLGSPPQEKTHVLGNFPRTCAFLCARAAKPLSLPLPRSRKVSPCFSKAVFSPKTRRSRPGASERRIHCEDLRDKRANPAFVKSRLLVITPSRPRRASISRHLCRNRSPTAQSTATCNRRARSFPAW